MSKQLFYLKKRGSIYYFAFSDNPQLIWVVKDSECSVRTRRYRSRISDRGGWLNMIRDTNKGGSC